MSLIRICNKCRKEILKGDMFYHCKPREFGINKAKLKGYDLCKSCIDSFYVHEQVKE